MRVNILDDWMWSTIVRIKHRGEGSMGKRVGLLIVCKGNPGVNTAIRSREISTCIVYHVHSQLKAIYKDHT